MRISCVLGPYLPVPTLLGGAVEKIFLALCGEFASKGHEVTMISRRFDGLPDEEMRDGIRHIRISSRDRPSSMTVYHLYDVVYASRAARALPPSDVTITNSNSLPLLLSKANAGKIYMSIARFPKGRSGLYARADRLQTCSNHIANAICEQSPSVAHLVKAIPNAFTGAFALLAEQEVTDFVRDKEIIFVGRVAREKGIDLLIRAFLQVSKRHPDWKLTVIGPHLASQGGDGDAFLSELKRLAEPAGNAVQFTGPVFDEGILADRYAKAAIFVYPSVAEKGEAFPLAPLEAMACGCAPVVSDLRCFDDALTPDVHGLSFDHRDATGTTLARALESLIQSDDLRIRLARAAKKKSRAYTPVQVAKLFLDDFGELTGLPA